MRFRITCVAGSTLSTPTETARSPGRKWRRWPNDSGAALQVVPAAAVDLQGVVDQATVAQAKVAEETVAQEAVAMPSLIGRSGLIDELFCCSNNG